MSKILKETPNIVKARSTAITDVKLISDKSYKIGSRIIEFQATGTKGDLYKVVFYFKDKDNIYGDVKIYCNCPMMKWGGPSWNSRIEGFRLWQMAKEVPPDIRDPKRIQKVCKHIIAAYSKIPKKLNEHKDSNDSYAAYVGNCQNIFDYEGKCKINIFRDVSDFATKDENAIEITREDFFTYVKNIPEKIKRLISGHTLKYLFYDGNIYVLYDKTSDMHYFFI